MFYHSHIRNNPPPPAGHVFQQTRTFFELIKDIIRKNLLTKYHDDRSINVASRVLTLKIHRPWRSCSSTNQSHFRTRPRYHCTNLRTKVHDDRTINVATRVLTRQMLTPHAARRAMDKRRSQKLTTRTL
ncbi:hypothetical protein DPMN_056538 [Dreissena polymorpha]|uniref:Uncharacterized protein n=1 Tax=Dreissena polymorpha TaxID=45954 RepID=A0A9D4CRW2_DREPO|nr:hypothetical protein DPMN_056538 [Dreissena polymorpha]